MTSDLEKERWLQALETGGRIAAVAAIRRDLGVGLREATDILNRNLPAEPEAEEPFIECSVFALGPYHPDIADCLEYSEERYASVPEGTPMLVWVLCAYRPSGRRALAKNLGIDVWDFNAHAIDPQSINKAALETDFSKREVEEIGRLLDAGFELFFCPNSQKEGAPWA
ncbi:MAG: hypothetical protein AAGM22_14760 [Acidobacteriota bacterium]